MLRLFCSSACRVDRALKRAARFAFAGDREQLVNTLPLGLIAGGTLHAVTR